jgi:hypothetical protein
MKADILKFLRTEPTIKKINFAFDKTTKVWPEAYQDVANLLDKGEIILNVTNNLPEGVPASYDFNADILEVSPSFNTANLYDVSFLLHECTHAHHDRLLTGPVARKTVEAFGYLAEATFREANGLSSLGGAAASIRTVAHRIAAGTVLPGSYWVKPADVAALESAVSSTPHYAKAPTTINSNGFTRGVSAKILRKLPTFGSTKE